MRGCTSSPAPTAGLTALSPGRFGPLPDDPLLTRGLWQHARYYSPVTSAPKGHHTGGRSPARIKTSQPRAHRRSGLVTLGNQNPLWACQEPFGTPRTMILRLVADIQNRLFWRVGTGRASECCVPSAGWSQASRDGQPWAD
jgi:hypothetical protein